LLESLPLRSGDEFSRAKLMESQRILAQQGQFDPAKIGINPKPVMRPDKPTDLVDIDLVLVEKTKP
jgi:outer membrane protein assembly factor BamA